MRTYIISEPCVACGCCAAFCPQGAILEGDVIYEIDPQRCNGCGICSEYCPVYAIILRDDIFLAWKRSKAQKNTLSLN